MADMDMAENLTQVMSPSGLPAVPTTPGEVGDDEEGEFLDGYGSVHVNGSPFEEDSADGEDDVNITNVVQSLFQGAVGAEIMPGA